MCGRSRTVLGGRQAVRNNSLYPCLAVSIARSVPHGGYTPFISQGNAAVGRQEQTREHASICTLMKVLSITNRPAGQASCAQQLSLSRCIDRSVYIPLHFSRRSQTRASSLCCRKCNQVQGSLPRFTGVSLPAATSVPKGSGAGRGSESWRRLPRAP